MTYLQKIRADNKKIMEELNRKVTSKEVNWEYEYICYKCKSKYGSDLIDKTKICPTCRYKQRMREHYPQLELKSWYKK